MSDVISANSFSLQSLIVARHLLASSLLFPATARYRPVDSRSQEVVPIPIRLQRIPVPVSSSNPLLPPNNSYPKQCIPLAFPVTP
ncbi:unnamed protein product [Linum trigynum]|uniref:Secreted protein n=1 Tax=Linum trigynum TaxID=586398 RepID=A0AAV2CGK5_9ROSI